MRVVVFGGAGFVGLNIVERLLAAGDEVVLVDRQAPPPQAVEAFTQSLGQLRVATADVADTEAVAKALEGAASCVYGAAITSDAEREAREPRRVLEVNLMGLVTVLEAARAAGLQRVVNLSSGSAYGAAGFGAEPLDEAATPPDPRTLYAISKFAGERVAARLAELWGLAIVNVRLSSVFGPWEHDTGARDTLSAPFQVMRAALRREPVRFERHDVRDWVYAPDVARAVEALLRHPAPRHDLYNIGPPTTWDIVEWADRLRPHLPGVEPVVDPAAPTVSSHGPRTRMRFRTERLQADLNLGEFMGLDATADHYAWWAQAHAALIVG
jgi:UDP-glucose 4-epimerase